MMKKLGKWEQRKFFFIFIFKAHFLGVNFEVQQMSCSFFSLRTEEKITPKLSSRTIKKEEENA